MDLLPAPPAEGAVLKGPHHRFVTERAADVKGAALQVKSNFENVLGHFAEFFTCSVSPKSRLNCKLWSKVESFEIWLGNVWSSSTSLLLPGSRSLKICHETPQTLEKTKQSGCVWWYSPFKAMGRGLVTRLGRFMGQWRVRGVEGESKETGPFQQKHQQNHYQYSDNRKQYELIFLSSYSPNLVSF